MFSKAIVRTPCRAMIDGISTAGLGQPDYLLALKQHHDYIAALKECGLQVQVLEANESLPDSCFVEDVALMTPHCAIITRTGAPSRREETRIIKPVIAALYSKLATIQKPGTVEAGDIMMVGSHYYIGLSARTNREGAEQMIALLEAHGMSASTVAMGEVLHLKTGLSYLENNNLLVCGEFLGRAEFQRFNVLPVDSKEAYAANSVWINGRVLIPKGFPKTQKMIESTGYPVRVVDVSEFQKLDGGLSCLSLRF